MEKEQSEHFWKKRFISKVYYCLKPLIPRRSQILVRRFFYKRALPGVSSSWPIDPAAAQAPEGWTGWPNGKRIALVLTHDVETSRGLMRCRELAELETSLGFRSSFNFLTAKYEVPDSLLEFLVEKGHEIGVHGVYHDGKLFDSYQTFKKRAEEINYHLRKWGAVGFRAPSMHCNLNWIRELNIEYDLSTFDTDPFEPRSVGVKTIFPFLVPDGENGKGFVELPYTLTQDLTLFVLMGEKGTEIWDRKMDWIAEKGGMALVNVHPDYMNFNMGKSLIDEYPASLYAGFLENVVKKYKDLYWNPLPREIAFFIKHLEFACEDKMAK